MSEVKLYKCNNDNETVAAAPFGKEDGKWYRIFSYNCLGMPTDGLEIKACKFYKEYTPLPEAPEVGSTAWAIMMMEHGYSVQLRTHKKDTFVHLNFKSGEFVYNDGRLFHMSNYTTWQLYAPPQPIVELLPHEFVHRQKVLVADCVGEFWLLGEFDTYAHGYFEPFRVCEGRAEEGVFGFKYCIPFEGNESLKGSQMQGEHGAVPKGYVPPHVPQLGDDDYWQVGDEVVDLAEFYRTRIITHVFENHIVTKHSEDSSLITYYTKNGCFIDASNMRDCGTLRVLYHDTSYVRNDGTVYEHIPTRPHKIIDTDTDGA